MLALLPRQEGLVETTLDRNEEVERAAVEPAPLSATLNRRDRDRPIGVASDLPLSREQPELAEVEVVAREQERFIV